MSWVLQGLQFLLTFVEIFMVYRVCDELIGDKKLFLNHKVYTYVCVIGMTSLTSINRSIGFFSDFEFYIRVIIVSFCIFFVKKEKLFNTLVLVLNVFLIIALLDYLFLLLLLFFISTNFMKMIYMNVSWHRMVIFLLSRGVAYGIYKKVSSKIIIKDIEMRQNIFFFTGIVGCVCLRRFQIAIVSFRADRKFWDTIFMTAFLIVICILFYIYVKNIQDKKQTELIKLKNDMLESNYNNLVQMYKKNQKFYHDYKNHLSILNQYLQQEKYEKAKCYADSMLEPFQKKNDVIWSESDIVNLVINLKSFEAEQKGIRFQIEIDLVDWKKYKEQDLGIIFFNLLDNAIEACEKVTNHERWIKVIIKRVNEMIFVKIQNIIEEPIVTENGKLLSKKKDQLIHGIGLQAAREAVERSGGIMKLSYTKTSFTIDITFF